MKYEFVLEDVALMEKAYKNMNEEKPVNELPLEKRSFIAGWIMATNKKQLKKELKQNGDV